MNEAILLAGAAPQNDLAIPLVMGPAAIITRGMAFGLFTFFFFAEAFRLQWKAAEFAAGATNTKPEFMKFLWRAGALFVAMAFLYKWTFLKMISLCDHIAMTLANEQAWAEFIGNLTRNGNTTVPLLNVTIPTLVGAVALTVLQYVEDIFLAIRFVILSLLFVIGPLTWAFSVSSLGVSSMKSWFANTWQVAFWYVVFAVIKAALVPLGAYAFSQNAASAGVLSIIYAIVFCFLIAMIPTLTAALFSGGHLGAVGEAAQNFIVSYGALRAAAARGDSAHAALTGGQRISSISEAVQAFRSGGLGAVTSGLLGRFGGEGSSSGGGEGEGRSR